MIGEEIVEVDVLAVFGPGGKGNITALSQQAPAKKIEGAWTFRFLRPLLDCAAKFLRLPGSIWRENTAPGKSWQEALPHFAVDACALLCKTERPPYVVILLGQERGAPSSDNE